jgi:putative Holliday junction resolvase
VYHENRAELEIQIMPGRILAIDFGMRRMGVAVSDPLGVTAQGLPTLERRGRDYDLRRIEELVEEYSAARVVFGNPVGRAGGETEMSRRVAAFAQKLRRRISCPVELWDERLTSVEANRVLRASGISIGKRQRAADRVAVTLLLQSYLDFLANQAQTQPAPGERRC